MAYYDFNDTQVSGFFTPANINTYAIKIKALVGQVGNLFGVYDSNDVELSGIQADGDFFAPNIISRWGEAGEFDLNTLKDDFDTLDNDEAVKYTGAAVTDNAIVRFDSTTGRIIQGYTSNAPTITDDGLASFNDGSEFTELIGATSQNTGTRNTGFGYFIRFLSSASQSVGMGYGLVIISSNSVLLGYTARVQDGTGNVGIGSSAQIAGTNCVAMGPSARVGVLGVTIVQNSNSIGANSNVRSTYCFNLGAGGFIDTNSDYSFLIGPLNSSYAPYGFVIGVQSRTDYSSLLMGNGLTATENYQFIVGADGNSRPYRKFYFGSGPNGQNDTGLNAFNTVDTEVHFMRPESSGVTDRTMRNVVFKAQPSTGTGAGGHFKFQTTPASGVSSDTINTHQDVLELTDDRETIHHGAVHKPIASVSTDTTLNSSHYTVLVDTSGGDVTITLPTAPGIEGRIYNIKKTETANKVIIDGNASETIDGGLTAEIFLQYESVTIQSDGSNWWVI